MRIIIFGHHTHSMYSKEEAYAKISDLVERFSLQIDSYKKSDYNETLTRQDFINPFFKALGWDIDNSQGNAEAYREVIHEDKLKIGSATKAPDYSFRLPGGKRLFFVEAKKPSVLVKEDIVPAYQVRRYGWSAKLPISLITDFEEFAVYDCTKKPDPSDKASTARIKYFTYKQYLDEFDFIWDTFSKASVLKGSFDKFIVSDTYKKGTTTVDKEFLASLDEWRMLLAQNIALRNQNFTEDELNFVVQQTLDRIIFLRIAEDRGVEGYGELKDTLTKSKEEGAYYKGLFNLFKEADSKYNSGLFNFKKDKLSANVIIDNKVIKTIISELYYPVSPYEFSVLGVEILGSAYEQFLGKQIKLSASHKAIIEEKPEVRKAGGVYYTPQYIVDYIVANTVGKLINDLEEKYTSKVSPPTGGAGLVGAVAQLKIVDPACGSGSFLIGVYKYLLNWHLNFYKPEFIKLSETAADNNSNTKTREAAIKQRNKLPLTPEGNLTTTLKKQILLNNIYGVDIDTQAVEVTKLSLLLKCMEGETGSSINAVMRFGERVLPTLDDNIKSGNSLIDVDFYDIEFDFGEEKKIKPFNWQNAFPKVFKQDGFDVVIGNPPYDVLEKDRLGEAIPHLALQQYIKVNSYYKGALGGKLNLYRFFIVKAIQLTKFKGRYGIIVPSSILGDKSCVNTRKYILSNTSALEFDCFPQKDIPSKRIFEDAKLSTTIFFGEKSDLIKEEQQSFKIRTYPANSFYDEHKNCFINVKDLRTIDPENIPIPLIDNTNWKVLKKIHLTEGIKNLAALEKEFAVRRGEINQTILKEFIEESSEGNERLIKGVQIGQYKFNKKLSQGKVEWFNQKYFESKNNKKEIASFRRIATQRITGVDERLRLVATIIEPKAYFADSTNSIHIISGSEYELNYLLGLINSKLFQWRFKLTSTNNNVGTNEIEALPVKTIDFKSKEDKSLHDEIVQLVETMLQLNKEKQQTTLPDKLEQLNTRIKYTDDKINKLVYGLYGLSEEEIGIVEGK